MKKLFATLFAAIAAAAVLAFAGCNSQNVKRTQIDEQTSIIIVASNDVLKLTADTTVEDYLNALKEQGKLDFEGSQSQYGLYLTSMDGKANVDNSDGTGSSWMFYIDFATLDDGAIYGTDFSTCEYEGKTLYTASFGVSGIPCIEGHTYAFVYEDYDYSSFN